MTNPETGVFALCESSAEVFLLVYREAGLSGVEDLFRIETGNTREGLRRDANTFARIGMKPLADLLRREARKAKPAPLNFKKRWPR